MMIRKKILFHYSLIILLLFEVLRNLIQVNEGGTAKIFLNLLMFLSLFLLPYLSLFHFEKYFTTTTRIFFVLIFSYAIFSLLRDIGKGELLSLFGNPRFGPSFLIPIFFLWGSRMTSLYWLNKICLYSVKAGCLLFPIQILFNYTLPVVLFVPTFFLLLNYKFISTHDRIWTILGTAVAVFSFWEADLRSGIIRILFCLLIILIIQLKSILVYRSFIILSIFIPFYSVYFGITTGKSLISELLTTLNVESGNDNNSVTTDTRTFLYAETLIDLKNTNSLLFGKGPLGSYYSEYFRNYNLEGGDHYIRRDVEVGVLHYLLKGGVVYLFLIFSVIIYAIIQTLRKAQNTYLISLVLVLSAFIFYSFIENKPYYSFFMGIVWILVGVCLSNKYQQLNDLQIKYLIQNKIEII